MKKKILTVVVALLVVCVCIGAVACGNKLNTAYDRGKQTKMDNFTLLNKTAEHGAIVMIGDSIVELFPTEIFNDKAYTVYNRGISGDTADRMLERLETNALNIKPRVLSVLIGTNDISRGIKQEKIVANIKSVVEKAKVAGTEKILIQSVYPMNPKMGAGNNNGKIKELNVKLVALCKENGVTYVNVFDSLKDDDGNFKKELTYDGLHPNAAGYLVIERVLGEHFGK